jgi:3-oxoacyl-[acyl-carrier protein] reductase
LNLDGKVAMVTGSSRGLGKEIALAFAEAGSNTVVHCCSRRDEAEAVAAEAHGMKVETMVVQGDVSCLVDVTRMAATVMEKMGRIDFLINNAGFRTTASIDQLDEKAWDEVIDVNLKGIFTCCKEFGAIMKTQGSGSIVNISSIGGIVVDVYAPHYSAAKAGGIHLARNLARSLAPEVRVNTVAPGWLSVGMIPDLPEETLNKIKLKTPLNRIGTPGDVTEVVLFLAAAAHFVTGQLVVVDGGISIS